MNIDKSKITIEKMTLADVKLIENNFKEFDEFWSSDILTQDFLLENSYYVVAKDQNNPLRILGFCGIKIILDEAEIMNIAVTKKMRHLGIRLFTITKLNKLL